MACSIKIFLPIQTMKLNMIEQYNTLLFCRGDIYNSRTLGSNLSNLATIQFLLAVWTLHWCDRICSETSQRTLCTRASQLNKQTHEMKRLAKFRYTLTSTQIECHPSFVYGNIYNKAKCLKIYPLSPKKSFHRYIISTGIVETCHICIDGFQ